MYRPRILGLVAAALVLVLDQAVKWLVTGPLGIDQPGEGWALLPIFDLRFVQNRGVSLGLLHAGTDAMRWALVAATAGIAGGVAWWMRRETNRTDLMGLGLVLGGALGNIIDRVRLGYVVDYADLHFGEWSPFLVFNIADAAISIGVLILLVRAFVVRDGGEAAPVDVEKANA